jgi:hypothetical protein
MIKRIMFILSISCYCFHLQAQIKLQSPELALSVIASDSTRAKAFYLNCLGLNHTNTLTSAGLKMFLFTSGQGTVKVRVYNTDPPAQNTNLTASNGIRFITIPVNNFDTVISRLSTYGFPTPNIRTQDGVRTAMAKDGDGNAVELLDAPTAPGRKMEIGLITDNVSQAQRLYSNILQFPVASAITGPSPVDNSTEYRYKANNTVLRFFAPAGTRPSDNSTVGGKQGYRYITFTLSADIDILYQQVQDSGLTVAVPLAPFGTSVFLFMVRGPGGALHEFVGPKHIKGPSTAFTDMKFTADYYAPGLTVSEDISGTLEANALVAHKGKIYCATTYAGLDGTPAQSDPKILVKDSANGYWRIDYKGGNKFVRFPIIRSVRFTSDGSGKPLANPVPVLVCGTGAWRSWKPDGVYVMSRNDNTGQWHQSKISDNCWNAINTNKGCEVRAIFDYKDKLTGVHYVFAGAYNGALYRGWYNPSKSGLIEWDPVPEIDSILGHALCSAISNDTLYVGMSFGEGSGVPGQWRPYKDYGIWKRIDGIRKPVVGQNYDPNDNLQWEWIKVKEWEKKDKPGEHTRMGQFRGMTAIPDPKGARHQVLAFHWDSPDNLIELVDPTKGYLNSVELNPKAFLQSKWGNTAQCVTLGYNEWTPAVHPVTKDSVHLIGAWATYPGGELGSPEGKSSWFFVRYKDATYNVVRIWDPNNPLTGATNGLKGCRSIINSPFPEEAGRVWYFCGFDLTGTGTTSVSGNKAWIYKGVIQNIPTGVADNTRSAQKIIIYPNPTNSNLFIKTENSNLLQYHITNSIGQVMQQEKIYGKSIDVSRLQHGIYFIQLKDEKGQTFTSKFIKE